VTVVEPQGLVFFFSPGSQIQHLEGIPGIGVKLEWYLLPGTVSFYKVLTREWGTQTINNQPGYEYPNCTGIFIKTGHDKLPHPPGGDIGIYPCKISLLAQNYKITVILL
jgi:hypothetical protein